MENILQDLAAMGIRYNKLSYTSDYFDQMQQLAVKLIEAGYMYADDTPMEQMREVRLLGLQRIPTGCFGGSVPRSAVAGSCLGLLMHGLIKGSLDQKTFRQVKAAPSCYTN